MATPMASEAADRVPAVLTRMGRRRQFIEYDKRLIVGAAISDGIDGNAGAASPQAGRFILLLNPPSSLDAPVWTGTRGSSRSRV